MTNQELEQNILYNIFSILEKFQYGISSNFFRHKGILLIWI